MGPIKISDLRTKALEEVSMNELKGLVTKINQGLLESYEEGKNWQFAYNSQRVDDLTNSARLKLKDLFEEAGYEVSFDSGVAYDEKPVEIVVSYDTRKKD